MIADQDAMKTARREAFASRDAVKIRAFFKRYDDIKLPVDDEELLRLVALCPVWE